MNKMSIKSTDLSTITLNIHGIHFQINRHRVTEWKKKDASIDVVYN